MRRHQEVKRRKGKRDHSEILGSRDRVESGKKTHPRFIYRGKIGIFPSPRAYI